jgi:histidinol-phosphate/aromatic aminotransferase/cobyric acid decarboxylase-like protein
VFKALIELQWYVTTEYKLCAAGPARGRRMLMVETDHEDAHRLTPRALDEAIGQGRHDGMDPRILIVNSPSNPTGGMFTHDDVGQRRDGRSQSPACCARPDAWLRG